MSETINLQEAILKEVRREKVPVTLFLMNGFQLRGVPPLVQRDIEPNRQNPAKSRGQRILSALACISYV